MRHADNASHVRPLPLTNGHECADTHTKQKNSTNVPILILRITQKTPVTSTRCLSTEGQTGPSPPSLSLSLALFWRSHSLSRSFFRASSCSCVRALRTYFEESHKYHRKNPIYCGLKSRVLRRVEDPATNTGSIKHMIRIFYNVKKFLYILKRALCILVWKELCVFWKKPCIFWKEPYIFWKEPYVCPVFPFCSTGSPPAVIQIKRALCTVKRAL